MKSSKGVKIGKVELEIGGKVIRFSLEEAKELRDILKDTFPEKEYVPSQPIFIREYPWWQYNPDPWRYWEPYYTTCGGSVTADDTLRLTCSSS